MTPLLEVTDLRVAYGNIEAVKGIGFSVGVGQVVTLIGGNGAGKTTTLRTLSGLLRPTGGRVVFEGEDITHLPAHTIVRRGIAHAPEGRRIFPRLTVLENLDLGAFSQVGRVAAAQTRADLDRIFGLFPVLAERRSQAAGTLSGGEQQMLAIGRALMAKPRLLMIDELSLGLAPVIIERLVEILERVNREGTTVLIVEQDVLTALEQASRGYVLEAGQITLSGPARDLLADERVKRAYLGV